MKKNIHQTAIQAIGGKSITHLSDSDCKKFPIQETNGFLKKEIRKVIVEIRNKRIERTKRQAARNKSVRRKIFENLRDKFEDFAKHIPSDGYSMGGVREIILNTKQYSVNTISLYNDSQEYARSCSYSAKHGHVSLYVDPCEIRRLKLIGGVITLIDKRDAKKGRNAMKRCKILASSGNKQHHKLFWENSFLKKESHGKTKEEALRNYTSKKRGEEMAKEYKKKERKYKSAYKKAIKMFYSFQDSRQAGNCNAGSLAFCKRNKLNPMYGYTGYFLLEIAGNQKGFVENMINLRIHKTS